MIKFMEGFEQTIGFTVKQWKEIKEALSNREENCGAKLNKRAP